MVKRRIKELRKNYGQNVALTFIFTIGEDSCITAQNTFKDALSRFIKDHSDKLFTENIKGEMFLGGESVKILVGVPHVTDVSSGSVVEMK